MVRLQIVIKTMMAVGAMMIFTSGWASPSAPENCVANFLATKRAQALALADRVYQQTYADHVARAAQGLGRSSPFLAALAAALSEMIPFFPGMRIQQDVINSFQHLTIAWPISASKTLYWMWQVDREGQLTYTEWQETNDGMIELRLKPHLFYPHPDGFREVFHLMHPPVYRLIKRSSPPWILNFPQAVLQEGLLPSTTAEKSSEESLRSIRIIDIQHEVRHLAALLGITMQEKVWFTSNTYQITLGKKFNLRVKLIVNNVSTVEKYQIHRFICAENLAVGDVEENDPSPEINNLFYGNEEYVYAADFRKAFGHHLGILLQQGAALTAAEIEQAFQRYQQEQALRRTLLAYPLHPGEGLARDRETDEARSSERAVAPLIFHPWKTLRKVIFKANVGSKKEKDRSKHLQESDDEKTNVAQLLQAKMRQQAWRFARWHRFPWFWMFGVCDLRNDNWGKISAAFFARFADHPGERYLSFRKGEVYPGYISFHKKDAFWLAADDQKYGPSYFLVYDRGPQQPSAFYRIVLQQEIAWKMEPITSNHPLQFLVNAWFKRPALNLDKIHDYRANLHFPRSRTLRGLGKVVQEFAQQTNLKIEQQFLIDFAGHAQWQLVLSLKRAARRRGKLAEKYVFTVVPKDHYDFLAQRKMRQMAGPSMTLDLPANEQNLVRVERFLLFHDPQNQDAVTLIPLPLPSFFTPGQTFEELWSNLACLLGNYTRVNAALDKFGITRPSIAAMAKSPLKNVKSEIIR